MRGEQVKCGRIGQLIGWLAVGTRYDELAVTNGVSLNGTLNIKLINGFAPAVDKYLQPDFLTSNLPRGRGLTEYGDSHTGMTCRPS